MSAITEYETNCGRWSDIQDHLPELMKRAKGNVLELGVRDGISTSALLLGVELHGGQLISVDVEPCKDVQDRFHGHPQWRFLNASSIERLPLEPLARKVLLAGLDVLFLDTLHTYDHVTRELELWAPYVKPGGTILIHDVVTFPAVMEAMQDHCIEHGLAFTYHAGSNGLGIISVPAPEVMP